MEYDAISYNLVVFISPGLSRTLVVVFILLKGNLVKINSPLYTYFAISLRCSLKLFDGQRIKNIYVLIVYLGLIDS